MTRWLASGLASVALAAGMPAWAQSDNFNRADATTLGPNWTQQTGSMGIVNNAAQNNTANGNSVATLNGAASNHIAFDITAAPSGSSVAAATFGFGSGNDYYLKLQSGGGHWTTYGFYIANNNSNSGSGGLMTLMNTTSATGHVDFSYDTSNNATIVYTATGGTAESYTFMYSFAPGSTSDGFALINGSSIDNFDATPLAGAAPEPASWTMMILGLGIAGGVLRRRAAVRSSFAG